MNMVESESVALTPLGADAIAAMSFNSLVERKEQVVARLDVIGIEDKKKTKRATSQQQVIPFVAKTDTHWDFCHEGNDVVGSGLWSRAQAPSYLG